MLSNSESDSILFGLVKVAEANIFLFAFTSLIYRRKNILERIGNFKYNNKKGGG